MIGFCVLFAFGVAYIAYRGVNGTTGVNVAINVIQISALLVFSVIAIGYRMSHNKDGARALLCQQRQSRALSGRARTGHAATTDNRRSRIRWPDGTDKKTDDKGDPDANGDGKPYKQQDKMITKDDLKTKDLPLPESYEASFGTFSLAEGDPFPDYEKDKDGKPVLGKDGKIQPLAITLSYAGSDAISGTTGDAKDPETFNYHASAASVVSPHNFNFCHHPGLHRHPDPGRFRVGAPRWARRPRTPSATFPGRCCSRC